MKKIAKSVMMLAVAAACVSFASCCGNASARKNQLPIPSLPLPPLILSLRPKQKPLLPLPPPKTIRLRPKKLPPLRNNAVPALPDELFLTEKKDLSPLGERPSFVFRGCGFAGYAVPNPKMRIFVSQPGRFHRGLWPEVAVRGCRCVESVPGPFVPIPLADSRVR